MAEKKKYRNTKLFDYLANILVDKSETTYKNHISDPDFQLSFQPVVILNYLSMSPHPQARQIVMDYQLQLDRMATNESFYKVLLSAIPRHRSTFIRYIK